MSNDINAAGYELKPWWPYVRELMSNQVTVESVTILENGVYTAPAGKAYSPVTVNVPTYEVDSLTVTENGTYTPETGNAYNSVTVNVPQTQLSSLSVTENGTYTPETGHAYNSVTVNVPSGSSDFSTAEVTLNGLSIIGNFPLLADASGQGAPIDYFLSVSERQYVQGKFQIALWKGYAAVNFAPSLTGQTVSISGDITLVQDNQYIISGDCTITVSEQT